MQGERREKEREIYISVGEKHQCGTKKVVEKYHEGLSLPSLLSI